MTTTTQQAELTPEAPEDDPPCNEDADTTADVATGEIVPTWVDAQYRRPDIEASQIVAPIKLGAIPYADGYWRLAQRIVNTEMVPDGMRGRPDAVVACFFKGFEMGMGPMQALDSFDMIKGKVAMKPEAMRALVMSHGHLFVLRDGVANGERFCEAEVRRSDWPENQPNEVYRYDWADGVLAGLTSKDNWKKNPRAMLDARATGGAARRYFADVIQGMSYTTSEVADFEERS